MLTMMYMVHVISEAQAESNVGSSKNYFAFPPKLSPF